MEWIGAWSNEQYTWTVELQAKWTECFYLFIFILIKEKACEFWSVYSIQNNYKWSVFCVCKFWKKKTEKTFVKIVLVGISISIWKMILLRLASIIWLFEVFLLCVYVHRSRVRYVYSVLWMKFSTTSTALDLLGRRLKKSYGANI